MSKKVRVSYKSQPSQVAGALANMIREGNDIIRAEVSNPQACWNLLRAVVLARQFLCDKTFPGNTTTPVELRMKVYRDRNKPQGLIIAIEPIYYRQSEDVKL